MPVTDWTADGLRKTNCISYHAADARISVSACTHQQNMIFPYRTAKKTVLFFTVAPKEVFPGNTIQKEAKRKIDGPGSSFVRILILSKRKKEL